MIITIWKEFSTMKEAQSMAMTGGPNRPDPGSYYDDSQPKICRISWSVSQVDFRTCQLHARALIYFDRSGIVDLDAKDLEILTIDRDGGRTKLGYELGTDEQTLGQRLRLTLDGHQHAYISYKTSPTAAGLQWLENPLSLSSQDEATGGVRSYIPCQDTDSVKFLFDATIFVPVGTRTFMKGRHQIHRASDCGIPLDDERSHRWDWKRCISPRDLSLSVFGKVAH